MNKIEVLRLISLSLTVAVIIAIRWWPGLNHRKFDWRLFKSKGRKKH